MIKPYPHQRAAINSVIKELSSANRATVIMPCGAGKTLICLWVAEKTKAKTVVVFVPSLALIHQAALEWTTAASRTLSMMAICSDQTVALDEDGIIVEKDEFWFPVLSSPKEITKFFKKKSNSKEIKVVFCTYQSSLTLSAAMGNFKFDLGIFDEAHRTAVKEESYFSAPLFDEYVPIEKRLFVTATPKQFSLDKRDIQNDFAPVSSMDNVEYYGKHCHILSFRKAIEHGIICDYKIIFPEVTSEMVAKKLQAEDNAGLSNNAVYNAAMQIALKKAIEKTAASKIVSFHTRVYDAEQFSQILVKNRILPKHKILHINGKQASGVRKKIMREFESNTKSIITNARCLTEGIDAPSVDMVAIFSNKKSKIDIVQGIGRALRKHPGKQYGYIMVPIFVDTASQETPETALAKPEAQILFEVLLALEQHDELLCEAIRKGKFREGYVGKNTTELLEGFFDVTAQKYLSSQSFIKALSVAIIDRLGSNWDKMVGYLAKFKNKYGHCDVPRGFTDNPSLASWVNNVRQSHRKGMLEQNKIQELSKLEFNWYPHDAKWYKRLSELKEFKKKHGHCNIPKEFSNISLAAWVNTMRLSYKKGTLEQNKVKELNKLGFNWSPCDAIWNNRFSELMRFKNKYGYCSVPSRFNDNIPLANWVSTVRRSYKKGILELNKVQELNKLGFDWNPLDTLWKQRVSELIEFRDEYGHCAVPQEYINNPSLASWINTVRTSCRKGILEQNKILELNKLGFVWNPLDTLWKQRISELIIFKNKHGHCDVSQEYSNNPTLASWVNTVRKSYRKGVLEQDKILELNKLEFDWNPLDTLWKQWVSELMKFKNKYGHCDVPRTYSNNPSLASWVSNVRVLYRNKKLECTKIQELNKLRFNWYPYDTMWNQWLSELIEFKKKHKHCNVPIGFKDNLPLAGWVSRIRRSYRRGVLELNKVQELNKLGFAWSPHDAMWHQRMLELREFKNKYGHCNVPRSCNDNRPLANWISTVRRSYKKGVLEQNKILELNKLGFNWSPLDIMWDHQLTELKKFKNRYGHCNVPGRFNNNLPLANWVNTVRQSHRKGVLEQNKILELNKLGFDWNPLDTLWKQRLSELMEFKNKNGHCNVPQRFNDNPSLAGWVSNVRRLYKKGILIRDKIQQLKNLGFV